MFTQQEIKEINTVVQTHPKLGSVMVNHKWLDVGNLLNRIREEYEALEGKE